MDIIKKLKKDKKPESVFDTLLKKKSAEEKPLEKPEDIEVTALTPEKPLPGVIPVSEKKETASTREFRTEGMHEFDIDSLGVDTSTSLKIEYKSRIANLIDENRFDEAIELINELKEKIRGK
ncbi:MAG: hypothetical protein N3A65_04085 [candidate division WOR-3 bacterium]|nr:hypothetical protein [candidate division WOR-3 bacterium]